MMDLLRISKREKSDMRILTKFVAVYCREHHSGSESAPFLFRLLEIQSLVRKQILLCPDCTRLLTYGLTMRIRCPHQPKPACKNCKSQCYRGDYKRMIREVMKFSGMYFVKRGRLDLLYHYFK